LGKLAPFQVEGLCGLTIDEIRTKLGTPHGTEHEPTELNRSAGIEDWDNTFERDGFELLVTFNARTRKVEDFFIAGDDADEIVAKWNLHRDSPAYRLEEVSAIAGPGITGIKVIPHANTVTNAQTSADQNGRQLSTRVWHDKSGKFSTEARFGGMTNGVVTLHKPDGTTVKIGVNELSESDRKWIESRR
jgi:hypothetical protein